MIKPLPTFGIQPPLARMRQESPALPNSPQPRFAGFSHVLQEGKGVRGENFQALLQCYPTPWSGQIPKAFLTLCQGDTRTLNRGLDQLAVYLRPFNQFSDLPPLAVRLRPGGPEFQCQPLGKGGFGTAYLLSLGEERFVYKVFHTLEPNDRNGPLGEVPMGLQVSRGPLVDGSRTWFTSPLVGWSVAEYIPDDVDMTKRRGKSMASQGFMPLDISRYNAKNGVTLDYGGGHLVKKGTLINAAQAWQEILRTQGHPVVSTFEAVPEALQGELLVQAVQEYPQFTKFLVPLLPQIPEADKLTTFASLLALPQARMEAARLIEKTFTGDENTPEAIQKARTPLLMALEYEESRSVLSNVIHLFPEAERKPLMLRLLQETPGNMEWVSGLRKLKDSQRLDVFAAMIANPRSRSLASQGLQFFEKSPLFPQAMRLAASKPESLYMLPHWIERLPASQGIALFRKMLRHPITRPSATRCIPYLPLEYRATAFKKCLGYKRSAAELGRVLYTLPEKARTKAFYKLLQADHTRRWVLRGLSSLPTAQHLEAFFKATAYPSLTQELFQALPSLPAANRWEAVQTLLRLPGTQHYLPQVIHHAPEDQHFTLWKQLLTSPALLPQAPYVLNLLSPQEQRQGLALLEQLPQFQPGTPQHYGTQPVLTFLAGLKRSYRALGIFGPRQLEIRYLADLPPTAPPVSTPRLEHSVC